ncbi:hemolysin family protein [Piscicoccus intestinalis]|uniref:hemolysin family protein n=1 Tax=Piscicoccus intestinalis TaxID=746033 RepID=UPI00278C4D8A|nr:hemolysin family protein [Piscicoccus intestinalis]
MNGWMTAAITVLIIGLSAFFVAIEFSLISAKRHRIEEAAASSRSARAALRSSAELTLLLAGSQLGITACTLALGAITKPALHDAMAPLLSDWGLNARVADITAFVLALVVATFLHLVIGEMMPKSWAIAHPERSAILLAIPMRGFMWLTRPILRALNTSANRLVRLVGIEPVDEVASGQDPDALRQLVEHSANVGALEASYRTQIEGALELRELTLRDLVRPRSAPTALPIGANVRQVQDLARRSGHLRVLLRDRTRFTHVVHVRDTLSAGDISEPALPFARPVFELAARTPVHEALATMRETKNHLIIVKEQGKTAGVITLGDILTRILPTAPEPDQAGRPATGTAASAPGQAQTVASGPGAQSAPEATVASGRGGATVASGDSGATVAPRPDQGAQ